MIVKICGITRAEDAAAAVAQGAHAIGFIFWPKSPRVIAPDRAREIAATLPPFVTPVGVFVNQDAAYINDVASLVGLGAVQLHGDESLEFARSIRRPVLKALASGDDAALAQWPASVMLLIDADDRDQRGGTGKKADWAMAAGVAARRRTILAGGLTPGNVAEAIARVRPYGIDVSSGVESAPGIKDPERLAALFKAVHRS